MHDCKPQKITFALFLSIIFFSFLSCATWDGRRYEGRTSRQRSQDAKIAGSEVKKHPVEKEVKMPERHQLAMADSPARSASMDMVSKGKYFLEVGKYDKALSIFQEAVIIDNTNGIAFYYLAKTRFYLQQYEEALGILDKAESLLTGSDEWLEAAGLLRTQIQTSYLSSSTSTP